MTINGEDRKFKEAYFLFDEIALGFGSSFCGYKEADVDGKGAGKLNLSMKL
jgi:hypothetical protein